MFEGVKIFLNDSWSWELISPVCWFWCCLEVYCIRKNLLRVRYGAKMIIFHETRVHFRTSLFVIAKQEYGFDHPSCAEQRSVKIHVFSRIKFFLSVIVESLRHDKERNEEQNTMGPFSWAQRF